jgi:hypothetical protein
MRPISTLYPSQIDISNHRRERIRKLREEWSRESRLLGLSAGKEIETKALLLIANSAQKFETAFMTWSSSLPSSNSASARSQTLRTSGRPTPPIGQARSAKH